MKFTVVLVDQSAQEHDHEDARFGVQANGTLTVHDAHGETVVYSAWAWRSVRAETGAPNVW